MKLKYTTRKQKRVRKIIIIVALLLLIAIGVFVVFKIKNRDDGSESTKNLNTASTSTGVDKPNSNQSELPASDDGKNTTDNSDNNPTPINNTVGMHISNYKLDQATKTITINTLIQTLDNKGFCDLTLSKDGTTLSATSTSFASSRVSNCHFEITSDLLTSGKWLAEISYESAATSATVNQEITL